MKNQQALQNFLNKKQRRNQKQFPNENKIDSKVQSNKTTNNSLAIKTDQLLPNNKPNHKKQLVAQENTQPVNNNNNLQINKVDENIKKDSQQKKHIILKSNQQIKQEVNRWRYISQTLQKKRQIEVEMQNKKIQFQKQKQLQQCKQRLKLEQEAKRLRIKNKLEKIQQRKAKRSERKQNQKKSLQKILEKPPLFQQKQKQFLMKKMVEQQQIKQNILKKKQQMAIDMEQILKHEQNFLNHLKQRFKRKQVKKSSSKSPQGNQNINSELNGNLNSQKKSKSQFNIFINGDSQQKYRDQEKLKRRKKFQEKIRKIPIIIDTQKMKQMLIARDKSKNPLKYNYLSNMGSLSDEKIYDQFKDFQININQKQLGNDYMRQMHEKIPVSSRIRSQSESQLKPLQKIEYKNYLPQVKSLLKRRPQRQNGYPTDQVEQILYQYENNSDRLAQLNTRSQSYKRQVIKKINQIKNTSSTASAYSDYLGKQKQIDDLYMRSIKMKLATAKIA